MTNTRLLILSLSLIISSLGTLKAQELSLADRALLSEKYFGNQDLMRAEQLFYDHHDLEARLHYKNAINTFEQKQQWQAWILASASLANTYSYQENYTEGIRIAKAALEKVGAQVQTYLDECYPLYVVIDVLYQAAYRPHSAYPFALKALSLTQKKYKAPLHLAYLNPMTSLGLIHRDMGDLDSALHYFHQVEAILLNEPQSTPRQELETLDHLSSVYALRGNLDQALSLTEKGLKLAIEMYGENAFELVMFYHNLAFYYVRLGESEKAMKLYKKEIYIIENSRFQSEPRTIEILSDCLTSLGIEYSATNRTTEGLKCFDKALSVIEGQAIESSHKSRILIALGNSYLATNDFEQALYYCKQAEELDSIARSQQPEGVIKYQRTADIYMSVANILLEKGDFDAARSYLQQARLLRIKNGDKELAAEGPIFYWNLAHLLNRQKQIDSALYYNQQALIRVTKNMALTTEDVLPVATDLKSDAITYDILNQKARLLAALAEREEETARKEYLYEQVINVFDLADEFHFENLKTINIQRGTQSSSLVEQSIQNYQGGISSAYSFYRLTQDHSQLLKTFEYVQKMKAQQLWLSLLKNEAASFANIPTALIEKERDLLIDIHYYENKILEARQNQATAELENLENNLLFESKRQYADLVKKIELGHPDYFESKYAFQPETEQSLQQVLKENELLIEYVFSDSSVYAFTLAKKEQLHVNKIKLDTQTAQQIETLHQLLQKSSWMRRSSREKFITLSHQLYQQLLQPLEDQMQDKDQLIIIGDGMTNYIPFEVLLSSDEFAPLKELNYLIKEHTVSYHYSASLFAKARQKKSKEYEAGMFAFAPVYDDDLASEPQVKALEANAELRSIENGRFASLPESEREVQSIISLFEAHQDKKNILALREAAHEQALKNNLEKEFKFIHIAGHSFANVENPKFSGIACAIQKSGDAEDGILYTGEIYALGTNADLVTLSSCESGFGKLDRTEGLLGLNRAFIYTGVPNVVFSLWKVYDKLSAQLMIDFYKAVLTGEDYAHALRKAKLNLLSQEATAAPHYWSPYLLIGK